MPRCLVSDALAMRTRGSRVPEQLNSSTSALGFRRIPGVRDRTLVCSRVHAETPQHRRLEDRR